MSERGRTYAERYRLQDRLGAGGAGEVWRAEDLWNDQPVALKILLTPDPDDERAFVREFQFLHSTHHPALPRAYWLFRAGAQLAFSLDLIEGVDFSEASLAEPESLRRRASELLEALGFIHDRGFVHRDLKPANVLVDRSGSARADVRVIDFGLAATRAGSDRAALSGTLAYVAPELLRNAPSSISSDLYSAALVIYESFTGEPTFSSHADDLRARIDAAERLPKTLSDRVPESWKRWLVRLLDPDPEKRPSSSADADALLSELVEPAPGHVDYRLARLRSGAPIGRDSERGLLDDSGPLTILVGRAGAGKTRLANAWLGDRALQGHSVVDYSAIDSLSHRLRSTVMNNAAADSGERMAILFDDAHLLDEQLIGRIRQLADGRQDRSILLTADPDQVSGPLKNLIEIGAREEITQVVTLSPLDRDAFGVIAKTVLGADEAELRWIFELSGGALIPLVEYLRTNDRDHVERVATRTASDRLEVVLSEHDELTVRNLAVLALLGAADSASIDRVLGQDAATGSVQRERLLASEVLQFTNGVWRLSGLDPGRIVGAVPLDASVLERAVAESNAAERADRASLLGRAMHRAGLIDDAIAHLQRAGGIHAGSGRFKQAASCYREALRMMERGDSGRLETWKRLADAAYWSAEHEIAVRACGPVARWSDDADGRASAWATRAKALSYIRRPEHAMEWAKRASAESEHNAAADVAIALCANAGGDYARAAEIVTAITNDAELPRELKIELANLKAAVTANLGDVAAAAEMSAATIKSLQQDVPPRLRAAVLLGYAYQLRRLGDRESALRYHEMADRIISEYGFYRLESYSCSEWLIEMDTRGDLEGQKAVADRALRLAVHRGAMMDLAYAKNAIASAITRLGQPNLGYRLQREWIERFGDGSDAVRLAVVHLNAVESGVEMTDPDPRQLDELMRAALRLVPENSRVHALALALLPEVDAMLGRNVETSVKRLAQHLERNPAHLGAEYELRPQMALARWLSRRDRHRRAAEVLAEVESKAAEAPPVIQAAFFDALLQIAEAAENDDLAAHARERGQGALQQAAGMLEDADNRRNFLNRPIFRNLRRTELDAESKSRETSERLMAVYRMIHDLNVEERPEDLLETMMDKALAVVRAERGLILLRDPGTGEFVVHVARDMDQANLADAAAFSRNVVRQAGAGRAVLALDTGGDARLREYRSLSAYGIRSVICVPLRSRGQVIGAVYLDNRDQGGLYSAEDLRFLEAFADHAAIALRNVQRRRDLESENERLSALAERRDRFGRLLGRSPRMQRVYDQIQRFAETHYPVLIQGASGTGKELVARELHDNGPRRKRPFVSENVAALSPSLIESELFGHKKGAFTGAIEDKPGLFTQADGGTLFLDEIGDMQLELQARLLRVLQEGRLRPVGGTAEEPFDVRVLTATHRDIQSMVERGEFRQDLMFRLQVLTIELPPLRDRQGDVPQLVDHFVERSASERGREPIAVDDEVVALLERYDWPGNVRELENAIRRLCVLAGDGPLDMAVLRAEPEWRDKLVDRPPTRTIKTKREIEKELITGALKATGNNKARAAKLINMPRSTFFRKLRDYSIEA